MKDKSSLPFLWLAETGTDKPVVECRKTSQSWDLLSLLPWVNYASKETTAIHRGSNKRTIMGNITGGFYTEIAEVFSVKP